MSKFGFAEAAEAELLLLSLSLFRFESAERSLCPRVEIGHHYLCDT